MIGDPPAFWVWFWPMKASKSFSDLVVTKQIWQSFQLEFPVARSQHASQHYKLL